MASSISQQRDRWTDTGEGISLVRPVPKARPVTFPARPDPVSIDLARSALLVIDMQNDFLSPDGWFARDRGVDVAPLRRVAGPINALAAAFRRADVPVVHLNWGVRGDAANLPANVLDKASACGRAPGYGDRGAHGAILVQGGWGAASLPEIVVEGVDLSVSKHRLSGFRDNELDQILRRLGVQTLFYTGVNLDRCVFATLTDGCFQGYDAVLVEDACATPSPAHVGDAVLYLIRLLYGFSATSADILAALDPPEPKET
jgi:nicotinamidase-related amidase